MDERQFRDLRHKLFSAQHHTRVGNIDSRLLDKFVRVIERTEGKLRELSLEQSVGPVVTASLAPDTSWNEYYGRNTPVEYCGPFTQLRYELGRYEVRRFGPQTEYSTHGVHTPHRNLRLMVLSEGSSFARNYIEPLIADLRTTVEVETWETTTKEKSGDLNLEIRIRIASLTQMI